MGWRSRNMNLSMSKVVSVTVFFEISRFARNDTEVEFLPKHPRRVINGQRSMTNVKRPMAEVYPSLFRTVKGLKKRLRFYRPILMVGEIAAPFRLGGAA